MSGNGSDALTKTSVTENYTSTHEYNVLQLSLKTTTYNKMNMNIISWQGCSFAANIMGQC